MLGHTRQYLDKIAYSWPWLVRYPLQRITRWFEQLPASENPQHIIITVANHFEPSWDKHKIPLSWEAQRKRVDHWCEQAIALGNAVRDHDGTPFRHTNFFPAEQTHPLLLEKLAELQARGYGEVEIHLHHGVEQPDTAENLRRSLVEFRDLLADEYGFLSRQPQSDLPMYAFVHGNLALANSRQGECCGVDSEMQILAETGCYADFTLPAIPHPSQVAKINAIYQCGHPLNERAPHRSGPDLRVGATPQLPILVTGPVMFDWTRRKRGVPVPRVDDGVLAANYPLSAKRLQRWQSAGIGVKGRPDWVFVKLYCHGFFDHDQPQMIGDEMKRFWEEVLALADQNNRFKVHFASAREVFNLIKAASDGREGDPHQYRNYWLQPIMQSKREQQYAMAI